MNEGNQKKKFRIVRTDNEFIIRDLHSQTLPEDHYYETDTKKAFWIVLDEKNNPVGFCILSACYFGEVFMARAGVLPCANGNGLHVRMLHVRARYAKKEGYKMALTYTKYDNIVSNIGLMRAGYNLYLPDDAWAETECLYWWKSLV